MYIVQYSIAFSAKWQKYTCFKAFIYQLGGKLGGVGWGGVGGGGGEV